MKQNDLKAGLVVMLRHIDPWFIVMSDCYIQGKYYLKAIVSLEPSQQVYSMGEYNNDLTHRTNPDLDIISVVSPIKVPLHGVPVESYKAIWQRPAPVDFLTASISKRRIRLSDPANYQTPLNDFQDVEVVLTQLSVTAEATRNSLILAKWIIEPAVVDPSDPETPIDPEDLPEGEE